MKPTKNALRQAILSIRDELAEIKNTSYYGVIAVYANGRLKVRVDVAGGEGYNIDSFGPAWDGTQPYEWLRVGEGYRPIVVAAELRYLIDIVDKAYNYHIVTA